jgi:hypothetical protein
MIGLQLRSDVFCVPAWLQAWRFDHCITPDAAVQFLCEQNMVKNPEILEQFENDLIRGKKADFEQNLKIVEALHEYALELGVFGKHPLDGLEVDLRIAKVVNQC